MEQLLGFGIGVSSSIVASLLYSVFTLRWASRITFRRVLQDIRLLNRRIGDDGYEPEVIVAIDRNATIVGGILLGFRSLSTVVTISTQKIRKTDGTREVLLDERRMPGRDVLRGKRVLLLICFNESGASLNAVFSYLKSLPDGPLEVRTAAMYSSASPLLVPRYCAREEGRNLPMAVSRIVSRMPWMTSEWRHVLGEERNPRTTT